jgi:predicted dehydrogenase
MSKIRWGVLGYGSIASTAVVPAIKGSYNGELLAIASRTQQSADASAHEAGAPRAYGSYEALLADPEVDAVYLALPNGLHEHWALQCAEAKKHVLCEPTISLGLTGAARMREAFQARGLRLVEGMTFRHHPQWRAVRTLLADKAIGHLVAIRAAVGRPRPAPDDHRWSHQLGGGALHCAASFGVDLARFVAGADPHRISAFARAEEEGGVATTVEALLEFPTGVLASIHGSMAGASEQSVVLSGTSGRIVLERPFFPGWENVEVLVERDGEAKRTVVKGANQFLLQVEHFARLVLEPDRTLLPSESGLSNAASLEAIARSAVTSRTVDLR